MRFLLAGLLFLHGLIHLMGFVAGVGMARIESLTQPVSRAAALVWLAAAVLFVASGALAIGRVTWWWVPAAAGLVMSQFLIAGAWRDAKFGTVANLLIAAPVLIAATRWGPWGFAAAFRRDAAAGLARTAGVSAPPVTEADLARLPPPVARYLRRAGVVGRPRVVNFHAVMRGRIRPSRTGDWLPFQAEQYSFLDQPTRLFLIESAKAGIPFDGYHRLTPAGAVMVIRLAGFFPVANARGAEMDRSETVTFLNDLCFLAPGGLLDAAIDWEPVDDRTVRASYARGADRITATLVFDAAGDLIDFGSADRSMSEGKGFRRAPWRTPVSAYQDGAGGRRFLRGDGIWQLPDGDFRYIEFELVSVEANLAGAVR